MVPRQMTARGAIRLLISALVIAAGPQRWAGAAGAQEWQASARLGYATVLADGRQRAGALVGGDLQYGLDDAWAVRVSADSSWHPTTAATGGSHDGLVRASSVTAGITYALDVMQLVPSFELGIGLLDVGGAASSPHRDLGVQLGLGAEYLLSRAWSIGLVARYQHFPVNLSGVRPNYDGDPHGFSVSARVGRVF